MWKYNKICLVQVGHGGGGTYNITKDGKGKLRFLVQGRTLNDEPFGYCAVSEQEFSEWWGDKEKLPGYETLAQAAESIVKQEESVVSYGCPLCLYTTKSRQEADKHVTEHISKIIKDFTWEES